MRSVGTATQVAEWYARLSGYRFHPTVIGQLYARARMAPQFDGDGRKIYSGIAIWAELEELRMRRETLGCA